MRGWQSTESGEMKSTTEPDRPTDYQTTGPQASGQWSCLPAPCLSVFIRGKIQSLCFRLPASGLSTVQRPTSNVQRLTDLGPWTSDVRLFLALAMLSGMCLA